MENDLGFKNLTGDNWLERDIATTVFVRVSDGQIRPTTSDDWVVDILSPKLLETIPVEIQKLFEVARGILLYGYFFYPLYALGTEQLVRIAEAAISFKCKTLQAAPTFRTFEKKIDFLADNHVISQQEREGWHAIRKFRNEVSHPKNQTILPPGSAIGLLEYITDKINILFSNT